MLLVFPCYMEVSTALIGACADVGLTWFSPVGYVNKALLHIEAAPATALLTC